MELRRIVGSFSTQCVQLEEEGVSQVNQKEGKFEEI